MMSVEFLQRPTLVAYVVGVASELIEGIVATAAPGSSSSRNESSWEETLDDGRTGRVSCNVCRGRRCERKEKERDVSLFVVFCLLEYVVETIN